MTNQIKPDTQNPQNIESVLSLDGMLTSWKPTMRRLAIRACWWPLVSASKYREAKLPSHSTKPGH